MPMKLLSVLANKDNQQQELARKILRTQEVEKLATEANLKLARAEADFAETMARNREKWALNVEEQQKTTLAMEKEVQALEKRKQQALIPIQMYKEEAGKVMLEAQSFLKSAKEKEEQADFLQEKLEEKLTEVADRETLVSKEEQCQKVSRDGIEAQKEQIKQGMKQLSTDMLMFHEKQEREEVSLAERKKEVALAEINFNARTEKYKRDLEALKIWDLQLKDERGTLDREYARRNFPI